MTVKDIVNLSKEQLNSLYRTNPKQMRKIATQLFSAANKRIRSLEKSPYNVASYEYGIIVGREGSGKYGTGPFQVKNKSDFNVRREIARAQLFMQAKTSTLSGIKSVIKDTEKRLSQLLGEEFHFKSPQDFKDYWDLVDAYTEEYSKNLTAYSSEQIQRLVLNEYRKGEATTERIEEERNRQHEEEFTDWDKHFES